MHTIMCEHHAKSSNMQQQLFTQACSYEQCCGLMHRCRDWQYDNSRLLSYQPTPAFFKWPTRQCSLAQTVRAFMECVKPSVAEVALAAALLASADVTYREQGRPLHKPVDTHAACIGALVVAVKFLNDDEFSLEMLACYMRPALPDLKRAHIEDAESRLLKAVDWRVPLYPTEYHAYALHELLSTDQIGPPTCTLAGTKLLLHNLWCGIF